MSKTPRMDAAFKELTSTTPRMNWQLDQCYREGCKLERELAAMTEQRDRLADALASIMPIFNFKYLSHAEKQKVKCASESLAAVEGGSDE